MGTRVRVTARSRRILPSFLTVMALGVLAAMPATAATPTPNGYDVVGRTKVAKGLEHFELSAPGRRIHVAAIARSSKLELQPVLAGGLVRGTPKLERTSAACERVDCLVAINGDFFTPAGEPSAGVVIDGEPVRSGTSKRDQLIVGPRRTVDAGALRFDITLVSSDLKRMRARAINVELKRNKTVLYTPRYGKRTGAHRSSVEMTMTLDRPARSLLVGQTISAKIKSLRQGGDTAIPKRSVVLAARGRDAKHLRNLWARVKSGVATPAVLLRVDAARPVTDSIGGRPVLIKDGKIVVPRDASAFAVGRHPRTLVGRTKRGDVLLVTVDGRQPGYSVGMSLREAAKLMRSLGAVDAINLDGGGSTSFVVKGRVVNQPSDQLVRRGKTSRLAAVAGPNDVVVGNVERPVAVSLAVVRRGTAKASTGQTGTFTGVRALGSARTQPTTLSLAPPTADDPASQPDADLPALVAVRSEPTAREALIPIAAMLCSFASLSLLLVLRDAGIRRAVASPSRRLIR